MDINALLADMSISPAHFIPHRTDLNALGLRRLERYVALLKIYGGELRYDGHEGEELQAGRVEEITGYLIAHGVSKDDVSVEAGPARGTGMEATQAILIRKETGFGGKVGLSGGDD